jgi:hypothetical protein
VRHLVGPIPMIIGCAFLLASRMGDSGGHADFQTRERDPTSVEPDRQPGGKPWESQSEGGRSFTSQPDQRPTGRYDLKPSRPTPHIQVGASDRVKTDRWWPIPATTATSHPEFQHRASSRRQRHLRDSRCYREPAGPSRPVSMRWTDSPWRSRGDAEDHRRSGRIEVVGSVERPHFVPI